MGMDGYTSCKGNPVHWKAIGYTTSEESCSGVTVTVTDSCDLSGASTCEKCAHVAFVQEISNIRSACHACECGEGFGRQCGCAHCDGNPESYCGDDDDGGDNTDPVAPVTPEGCDLSGASTCEKCAHVAFVQEISNIRSACHACECGEEFGRQCGCAHCDGNPEPYCGEDEGTEAPAVDTEAPADDTDAPAVETEAPLDCCTGEFLGTAEDLACFKAPSNKNGVCDGYATEDGQYVKCTVTWGDMCRAFSLNPCQVCTEDEDTEAPAVETEAPADDTDAPQDDCKTLGGEGLCSGTMDSVGDVCDIIDGTEYYCFVNSEDRWMCGTQACQEDEDTEAPAVETEEPLDCCSGEFLGTAEDLACFKAPSNKNGVCDGYATEDGQYVKCTVTWGDMYRAFSLNPCQ